MLFLCSWFPAKVALLRRNAKKTVLILEDGFSYVCIHWRIFSHCIFLLDDVETAIRHQSFRNADAIRGLVVLQKSGNNAWQGQCGTVQSMA